MNKEVQRFWSEIRNLAYAKGVWNYKDNGFWQTAEDFGLVITCCDTRFDKLDYNFCPKCGSHFR